MRALFGGARFVWAVELQEEGKSLDDRRPPMDRHIWTDFPPIPGFEDMTQDKERQEKDKARQRQTKA